MLADYVVIDFETQSAVDIKKAGAEKYAADASTRVLCLGYIWPRGEPQLWASGQVPPADLCEHVAAGRPVIAHNAPFELAIWREKLEPAGWPRLTAEQTHCTMARALAVGMPAGLAQCAKALGLPVEKDEEGHRVMMKLARPRKKKKGETGHTFWSPNEAPDDFAKLYAYCVKDVVVERAAHEALPPLPPKERALWVLDRTINDRGVFLDLDAAERAIVAVAEETAIYNEAISRVTWGAVKSVNSRAQILSWVQSRGVQIDNLKKATVAALLDGDDEEEAKAEADPERDAYAQPESRLPADVRAVLEIRREAAKASTAKFKAMLASACGDSRARGLMQYHGAGTGRWAGRRIQTQNMPRPQEGFGEADAVAVLSWLGNPAAPALYRAAYGGTMAALSSSLRSLICAAPGSTLISADYSNIEGRVIAWLAGEADKLVAFVAFDTPLRDASGSIRVDEKGEPLRAGPDLYKRAVSRMLNIPVEKVTKYQRQSMGKVSELALGFQGGVGAFCNMAAGYGVDLTLLALSVKEAAPADVWGNAARKLPREGSRWRYDLDATTWTGIKCIVDMWRASHPAIVKFWYMLDEAAQGAVSSPGVVHWAGQHIAFCVSGDYLLCKLPSGRCLAYPYPEMRLYPNRETEAEIDNLMAEQKELEAAEADGRVKPIDAICRTGVIIRELGRIRGEVGCEQKGEPIKGAKPRCEKRLAFWGLNSKKQWSRTRLYGGLLAENVTQAVARDVLADALGRCEAAGLPVVMHVHDEIVCEVPENGPEHHVLEKIMTDIERWARGLPVAAEGWTGRRYRK